jgi:hypothetical protein
MQLQRLVLARTVSEPGAPKGSDKNGISFFYGEDPKDREKMKVISVERSFARLRLSTKSPVELLKEFINGEAVYTPLTPKKGMYFALLREGDEVRWGAVSVTVIKVKGRVVRMRIFAPREIEILRDEII